ncbi:phosphoribosylanthranilate isomerase [Pontixanthobacter gangjinensis]|uniref:N-(5'-phosphoribosyl)anthranilate isomerase n=1 Tax=Christiangramia aestuarii TaxID=1028746 RepID=A0A7M3SY32_9FLAO|nr:phosphoribosylanthranilate isomerase [Christiangramia aestuarii]MUP41513.1 phosphoribosylanthranilate isomerase [Christiangramia aestuarii]
MDQKNMKEKSLITPASGQSSGLSLKVCGMQQAGNMIQVAELQPDYMGLIFYDKSPRYFEGELPEIPAEIKKTGVFVNAEIEEIKEKVLKYNLNAIQLHGEESAGFAKDLKHELQQLGNTPEIIKVFSVGEDFDFQEIKAYEGIVDYFLFDTKGKLRGGNGKEFDWQILKDYPSNTPFFLSGGIGPEHGKAIAELKNHFYRKGKPNLLYAVDVNSKFELKPGLKKLKELKEFKTQINS